MGPDERSDPDGGGGASARGPADRLVMEEEHMWLMARCNQPVAAWKFVQPMRCNLERGHAGECDNRTENRHREETLR